MQRKMLIAVDGSSNSCRAVEYAGEVVGSNKGFTITLVHVEHCPNPDTYEDKSQWRDECRRCRTLGQDLLDQARQRLVDRAVPETDITVRFVSALDSPFGPMADSPRAETRSAAREIIREVRQGEFNTVVVGRRGVSKAEEFLFGSVSNSIMHELKGRTIWVVA